MTNMHVGQPWHGTYSAAGLTLENSTLRIDFLPPLGSNETHYVNFGMPAAPTPSAFEASLGMTWKNDIILCGRNKEYSAVSGFSIGQNGWLYRTADGTVYHLFCNIALATGNGTIWAGKLHSGSSAEILAFSVSLDPYHIGGTDNYFDLNQSPSGGRAVLCIGHETGSATSSGTTYNFIDHYNAIVEFTLTGGSASAPPSCSYNVLYNYTTIQTVNNLLDPLNHSNSGPGVWDTYAGYTNTTTRVVFVGYNSSGVLQIIETRSARHGLNTESGIDRWNMHFDYFYTFDATILVNGAIVYSGPHVQTHRVGDIAGDAINKTVTLTIDEYINFPDYDVTVFQVRHLSNCLCAFGLQSAGAYVVHQVRSFDGAVGTPLVGKTFGGTDLDSVTLAAYDYRNGTLVSGIHSGVI